MRAVAVGLILLVVSACTRAPDPEIARLESRIRTLEAELRLNASNDEARRKVMLELLEIKQVEIQGLTDAKLMLFRETETLFGDVRRLEEGLVATGDAVKVVHEDLDGRLKSQTLKIETLRRAVMHP